MTEPTTTTPAVEPVVTPPVDDTTPVVADPSETAINDALNAATGGIEGALVTNDGAMNGKLPEDEEPTDGVAAPPAAPPADKDEGTEPVPVVTDIKTDEDKTGVFAPPATVDPGEYKPADYSFEIKTTDNKVHKITSLEEAQALAAEFDENPELVTPSQFIELGRKVNAMEQGLKTDRDNYDKLKQAHEAESAVSKVREDVTKQWDSEIKFLRDKGDLPEMSDEMNRADWTDPKIAEDPAVKATLEVFKWMETENNKRIAAGLEPMRSAIDAHTAMQLEAMKNQGQQEEDKETKARKARGSMVGGRTSYEPSPQTEGSIVGVGGSLRDIGMDDF